MLERKSDWTLVYTRDRIDYEIDLQEINTCGAMLDWIFQLLGRKTWMTVEDGADLIEAFRTIFHPQKNLCYCRLVEGKVRAARSPSA